MLGKLKQTLNGLTLKKKPSQILEGILANGYATETEFQTKPFKLHKLEQGPSTKVTLNKNDALDYYKKMHAIRRLETAAGSLYKEKIIRGFCHLYSGQEAICVGCAAALRKQDLIITAYRDHGWAFMVGIDAIGILSELTGRQSGCSRGKGGSMHMYTETFFGGNGIVGAQVPLGAGMAFAQKYLGTGGVCLALYGDGAANQGQVFEAYNMSKLWDLPVIYICENNGYGMGTSAERAAASTLYYTRGDYIPGLWVDGMDILAVREAIRFGIEYCTSGKGPLVMEMATYRYSGHSMSDPGTSYRTREEIQEVRQTRDPVTSFKEKIIGAGFTTAEELKAIDTEIRQSIDEAVKKAKIDKEIENDELTADIYSNPLESSIRGVSPYDNHLHKRLGAAINTK